MLILRNRHTRATIDRFQELRFWELDPVRMPEQARGAPWERGSVGGRSGNVFFREHLPR